MGPDASPAAGQSACDAACGSSLTCIPCPRSGSHLLQPVMISGRQSWAVVTAPLCCCVAFPNCRWRGHVCHRHSCLEQRQPVVYCVRLSKRYEGQHHRGCLLTAVNCLFETLVLLYAAKILYYETVFLLHFSEKLSFKALPPQAGARRGGVRVPLAQLHGVLHDEALPAVPDPARNQVRRRRCDNACHHFSLTLATSSPIRTLKTSRSKLESAGHRTAAVIRTLPRARRQRQKEIGAAAL